MPDHIHQLAKGLTSEADAKDYIKRAKQYAGYYFKKAFGADLWERDGFNHVILGDLEVNAQARYILENPVRAGLVIRAEDYPFSGSQIYTVHQLMEWVYGR